MTIEEFNNKRFGGNMFCTHQGEKKFIMSVDFNEALLGLTNEQEDIPPEEWEWVRCENVTILEDK